MKQKRYWLRGGLIFLVISVVLGSWPFFFGTPPLGTPVNPSLETLESFLGLVLFITQLPAGIISTILLSAIIFSIIHLITFPASTTPLFYLFAIISAFIDGALWGWIYGIIKNKISNRNLIK